MNDSEKRIELAEDTAPRTEKAASSEETAENGVSHWMPLGMCLGISIGMCIGAAMGNIAIGMCIGVGFGTCLGALYGTLQKNKNTK